MPPLISIIMPVKNTASYLEECLDSILAQTYSNWELIAIDDHSTDTSAAILRNYADRDTRIQVWQNEGTGIIHALRTAYQKCKGTYITRMDSDDRMTSNKLDTLWSLLAATSEEGHIAIGQVQYFSDQPLGNGFQRYERWLNSLTVAGKNYQDIYKECSIPSPCWMVHRKDLDKCGAFQSERYPEDYDLCFRFYQQGLKVIPCDKVLHHWRDYPTRTSRTDPHYSDNRFLEIKLDYFLQLDYQTERTLLIWGAGKKGKWIAQELVNQQVPFHWVCNNPNKIGQTIYGCILENQEIIADFDNPHSIIAIANPEEQDAIKRQLKGKAGVDYFFFC